MKTTRKLAVILMAVAVLFALAIPAFAVEVPTTGSITIRGTTEVPVTGKSFAAYRVLDLTVSQNADSSYNYAYTVPAAMTAFYQELVKNDGDATNTLNVRVQNYLASMTDDSAALFAFAKEALAAAKTAGVTPATATGAENTAVFGNLPLGYYVVEDTTEPSGTDSVVSALMLDTNIPDPEITIKADTNTIDKVIVEGSSDVNGTSANVGDTVNFKTTTAVPDMMGYTSYTYKVYDTMSDGLTYDEESLAVTVDGTAVTASDSTWSVDCDVEGKTFVITFNYEYLKSQNVDASIVITYSATLNGGALITDKETNLTFLEYSNDPADDTSTTKTPDEIVYVYDFDVIVDKYVKGNTAAKLAGAKFKLYKMEGETKMYYVVDNNNVVTWTATEADATEVVTDTNGHASFKGVEAGTYYLTETEAPDGYNKLSGDVTIAVTATYNEDGTVNTTSATLVTLVEANAETGAPAQQQYQQTQGVENSSGSLLPSTGGIGTTLFITLGSILAVGAFVFLLTAKRMKTAA